MVSNINNIKKCEKILDNEFENGFQRGLKIAFHIAGCNCEKCELAEEECSYHNAGSEECVELLTEGYK